MGSYLYPWDSVPAPVTTSADPDPSKPKPRGRRPASATRAPPSAGAALDWRYHHLSISGPAAMVETFAAAARGSASHPGDKATTGRRLPKGHAVIGYGFFTHGETPHAAITQLAARWTALRFSLVPRPAD